MSKPLIYIDQNILGFQIEGALDLAKISEVQWVYSKEHFTEIRRSDNPQQYLEVLKSINAKLLTLVHENWKITGTARLNENVNPEEHYAEYLDATSQIEINQSWLDGYQVWVNGGGNEELLRSIPDQISAQIQALNEMLPAELHAQQDVVADAAFSEMIEQMVANGNDINKTREFFGGGKGRFGDIKGENQLRQIWEIIQLTCPGITCDQFFGFEKPYMPENEPVPLYLGIVGCCTVLDMIGFQAEKKIRCLEKIPNVRSDAAHIGMGAYCSAILSADRRLSKRAKAIYEYKNTGTVAIHLEVRKLE